MKLKANRNWLLLTAAIAMGLVAAFLMNKAVQQRMAQLDEQARVGQEMLEVVVANRDLGQGDVLNSEVLAVRQIPKQYVHAAAISTARFAQIENARLQVPIRRGEALLAAHIDGLGNRVFSTILKKGMRALTLEVDDISSTAGMLRPGDRVDLIYSVKTQDQTPGGGERILFPLLSDVSVLATGQSVTKQDAKGAERRYTNVTLEVSAENANRILLARSTGELTAILRSPDDDQHNGGAVLTPDALIPANPSRLPQHPRPAVSQSAPCIEFLVGGAANGGQSGCVSLER